MLVERCKFMVCRGCRKIPANPSSLRDEESHRGSHRRPSHPPRRLTSSSTPYSVIPRKKNSGLHFSKEPTHPRAWTMGLDAQPDVLSSLLPPHHRQRPFFRSHACLHVCLLACLLAACLHMCVRARHRCELRRVSSWFSTTTTEMVSGCFFRDDARPPSPSDVYIPGTTARKTIIFSTDAKLHLSL